MELSELVSIALTVDAHQGKRKMPFSERCLIEKTLQKPREALPLHTLGVSLARALAHGQYMSPEYLDGFDSELRRDNEGYCYFYGIRVAYHRELSRAQTAALVASCNELLGNGIIVSGHTADSTLAHAAGYKPQWDAALHSMDSAWLNPQTQETVYVLSAVQPLKGNIVRVVRSTGIDGAAQAPQHLLGAAILLKSQGFVQAPYPNDYSALSADLAASGVTPEQLRAELCMNYLV